MIRLSGKTEEDARVQFTKRKTFKGFARELDLQLVYGHACPRCHNVVQALFFTDEPVDLWAYEETVVISLAEKTDGEILHVYPEWDSPRDKTCYTSNFFQLRGKNAQHIALKNHILKYEGFNEGPKTESRFFETGERTCEYTGFFSVRPELLVQDTLRFCGMVDKDLDNFALPPLDIFLAAGKHLFRTLPAIGRPVPPVVMVDRGILNHGYGFRKALAGMLEPFQIDPSITVEDEINEADS